MKEFRDLRADEIELRVGICKENGLSLLLYKKYIFLQFAAETFAGFIEIVQNQIE